MPLDGDSSILVPVDVSTSEPPDAGLLDFLRPIDVVLLGYYPVPAQTPPAQLRADHEDEATERLASIADDFAAPGHQVEDVLVFTQDHEETIDRVADEHDCAAVLVPGTAGPVDRILVPLRGDVNLDRIVSLVATLVRDGDREVTLFHAVDPGTDPSQGEFILRGAVDRLTEEGVDRDRLEWRLSEEGDPEREIAEMAESFDLVILGETEPSLTDRIIGTVLSPIIERIDRPAVIVRDV